MSQFFRADNDRWINKDMIRWVEKGTTCFYICSKQDGCSYADTHRICPESPDFKKFMNFIGYHPEKKDDTLETSSYGVVITAPR